MQAWDLFEQGNLFFARNEDQNQSDSHHLAEMIAYLGLPPREMLEKSEYANKFFDISGKAHQLLISFGLSLYKRSDQ